MSTVIRGAVKSACLPVLLMLVPGTSIAGPVEDAKAALARWSTAYSSNDPDTIVGNYWPDAILLGTVSPVISVGPDAIRTYFSGVKNSGNKNEVGDIRAIVLSDDAVVLTGYYLFTRIVDGKPVPGPSRFTMLMTRHDGVWRIAHHHSSPHVLPR